MKILKFGGSSVATPERIQQIVKLVASRYQAEAPLAVVVSAFGGVTDALIATSHQAAKADLTYKQSLVALKMRHLSAASLLVPSESLGSVSLRIEEHFQELGDLLQGVYLIRELSPKALDFAMSFGERLSAYIISQAMKQVIPEADYCDTRFILITDANFGMAQVDKGLSYSRIRNYFVTGDRFPIITGFIAATLEGDTTTLGRGGSDYTASLFGSALEAEAIEIWTDVDGILTADPRKVIQARTIPMITYREAMELCHFGAKVIHPPTIGPAMQAGIPLWVKNTFNPKEPGTLLVKEQVDIPGGAVRGLSSIDRVALIRIEGGGMIGVAGVAMRLFSALARKEISVILITQASSEYSICFALSPSHVQIAKEAIELEFTLEMQLGLIDPLSIDLDTALIAVVGDHMRHTPGISGELFSALGRNGVNVIAVAQGSSERNISVAVRREDESKALNALHEAFFISPYVTLHVYLIGVGTVGSTLLEQIKTCKNELLEEQGVDIKIVGLANRRKMCFDPQGLSLENWQETLEQSREPMELVAFLRRLEQLNLYNSVMVDCTTSQHVADSYIRLLEHGIAVVTPNKKANSGPYSTFETLRNLKKNRRAQYHYETNVGAGLPIIHTLHDLRRSGDKIQQIEGILSGTLSYLFNHLQSGDSFSEKLKEAQKLGYTEPDPRDDLTGLDVARKLLILARESGDSLELRDIEIVPLLSDECWKAPSVEAFFTLLEKEEGKIIKRLEESHKNGEVLRYIARWRPGRATVALESVGAKHPFYLLEGSDNIISFTTDRYRETPLVVKGPGAGAAVTAAEVLADLVRVALQ